MNYPLAEAILGFAGAHHLDDAVVRSHHEYSQIRRLSGEEMAGRLEAVLNAYAPETTAVQLNLLDSHDTPRIRTLFSRDEAAVRMAFLLQATLPGAPCIYYGDEIGLEGANDPDCRRAFPWDEAAWDQPTLTFVRAALRLRHDVGRSCAAAACGSWDVGRFAGDPALGTLGCERATCPTDAPPALIVVNAGEGAVALTVEAAELAGAHARGRALATVGRARRARLASRSAPTAGSTSSCRPATARSCCARELRQPSVTQWRGRVYTRASVADLPFEPASTELIGRLLGSLDVEGKVPRAIEALGPVGGRDVVLLGGGSNARTTARGARSAGHPDGRLGRRIDLPMTAPT